MPYALAWRAGSVQLAYLDSLNAESKAALRAFEQCLRSDSRAVVVGPWLRVHDRAFGVRSRIMSMEDLTNEQLAFAPENDSILRRLKHWAKIQPAALAYVFLSGDGTPSLTFGQLADDAANVALTLRAQGVAPGERVVLICDSGLEFIIAFFGCLFAGAIAVPVQPPRKSEDMTRLAAIFNVAEARFAWMDDAVRTRALPLFSSDIARVKVVGAGEICSAVSRSDFVASMPMAQELALLQFTSGSTGMPRGVMVSHANLIANQYVIRHAFGHDSTTVVVSWLPHYHDMGLVGMLLQPLFLGRSCYFMSPARFIQRPLRWLEAISKYGATTSGAPNFGYELCVRGIPDEQLATSQLDLSTWRVAYNGAEPVRAETLDVFAERFAPYGFCKEAFLPCYGMAEATLLITGGPPGHPPVLQNRPLPTLSDPQTSLAGTSVLSDSAPSSRVVGCGQAALGHEVIIVDPEGTLPLPDGQAGEIYVRGPSIAKGYWNNPSETVATFAASLSDGRDHYLRTGDIGFIRDGELFITGRIKSLIIVNGRNMFLSDIENVIRYSHGAFRPQCAVLDLREQSKRIVVVQEVDPRVARDFVDEQLKRHVRKMASSRFGLQVEVFLTISRLPLTSSGKLRRGVCRTQFLDQKLRPYQTHAVDLS